jgi:hypothetical protein
MFAMIQTSTIFHLAMPRGASCELGAFQKAFSIEDFSDLKYRRKPGRTDESALPAC